MVADAQPDHQDHSIAVPDGSGQNPGEPPDHWPALDRIARAYVVDPCVAPAATVAIAVLGTLGWQMAVGAAGRRSVQDPAPAHPGLVFDLASVTKPFVALTAARLAARGVVDLGAPVSTWVPETRGTPTADVPLELLLAHRGGLLPHVELFAPLRERRSFCRTEALERTARARSPDGGTGSACYSCLGYVLVGEALSRATGLSLDDLVHEEVCAPGRIAAASARQWIARRPDFASVVAPTELVEWRGGELRGLVHDENAWALGGHGMAGQAGLFADAEAVARLGASVIDASRGARDSWLTERQIWPVLRPREGGTWRAGFDGKSAEGSAAGSACSRRSFGHLGFTGTSLWCDPDARCVTVLLTNRVNPTRDHWAIRAARPLVHDALHAAAMALR
jgi:CubicO group peptidase (beta-lactamase class C family)